MTAATPTLWDHHLFTPEAPTVKGGFTLRPYQTQAVESVLDQFKSVRSTLGVAAVGMGKTIIFAHIIDRMPVGRCLVLAHREELITQAAKKIQAVTGKKPDIEMGNQWADIHSIEERSEVVVSSIQTQCAGKNGGRMSRFSPDDFGLVVIDEAHHAPSKSYRKVIDYYCQNPNLKVLGVTATPDRADKLAMGQVFESVAFDFDILYGINNGWLCPITCKMANVSIDFSKVHTLAGDFNQKELAKLVEEETPLHEVALGTIQAAQGRRTLVFCVSVKQAELMAEIFNRYESKSANWISGKTPKIERRQILRDFAKGKFKYLVNVGVLTEGYDDPGVEVISMARPTKSRSLYTQCIGRGTRTLPGVVDCHHGAENRREAIILSSKPCCEVIDFTGNSGDHKLITTADILAGKHSDEAIERTKKKAKKSPTAVDPMQLLNESEIEIKTEKERKRKLLQKKREYVQANANVSFSKVNPFDVLDIKQKSGSRYDNMKQPTEKMKTALTRFGVDADMSFGQARQMLDTLFSRSENGWCTYKQAKILQRAGIAPKGVRKEDASKMIDRIFSGEKVTA
ncbi:MAG: DEAD/DEAH box helicase family protein [Phycisphaeraceae bacterium]|nr:DEAD/DEAH box helicase family protein [Phycisphaeraceae bacterium]